MAALVPGGLYGTDGVNLYLIDTASGAASLIGPHGPVEFAIGPPGGQARDINGLTRDGAVVYGIDWPSNSLGRLDVATGSYPQIGLTAPPSVTPAAWRSTRPPAPCTPPSPLTAASTRSTRPLARPP
jgi:hypothetical protein